MKIPCQIDQTKTLKEGMKIRLSIPDEEVQHVLKNIHNFHGKDLIADLQVDGAKEAQKLDEITNEQRKKIYALFGDISRQTGQGKKSVKNEFKKKFTQNTDYPGEYFSLSNCKKETASDFIEYIIESCWEMGIGIEDDPKDIFEDLERAMHVFLDNRVCAVCGKENADIHHIDAYGMGSDRTQVDDSDKKKIALCREGHTEAETIGWETFKEKYHVKGVK